MLSLRVLCEGEDATHRTVSVKTLLPSENGLYGPEMNRLKLKKCRKNCS